MEKEPEFKPKPGQIDYTHAKRAPVINCVVRHRNTILIVQRNSSMRFYPGYWNGISGFLDDDRGVEQKARDELKEELGLGAEHIMALMPGTVFEQHEPSYDKTWIVHPVLVDVNTDHVTLDWEAQKYRWVKLGEVQQFDLLPGFDKVLTALFPNAQEKSSWKNF